MPRQTALANAIHPEATPYRRCLVTFNGKSVIGFYGGVRRFLSFVQRLSAITESRDFSSTNLPQPQSHCSTPSAARSKYRYQQRVVKEKNAMWEGDVIENGK